MAKVSYFFQQAYERLLLFVWSVHVELLFFGRIHRGGSTLLTIVDFGDGC